MKKSSRGQIGCEDFRRTLALSRRGFVKAGVLGMAGLALPELLKREAVAAASGQSPSRQKSVIILWMRGGPSQIDTWDMKPNAPSEYRGEFKPIATKVPGIQICEHLPMSAKIMDKWSIIRSLHHNDAGHSAGDQVCFTGYPPGQNVDQNYYPSIGSITAKQLQHENPKLPAYVMIPKMVPGTGPAYLGQQAIPFETFVDPAQPGPFSLPNFEPPTGVSLDRLDDRQKLLSGFDKLRRDVDQSGQLESMDRFQNQAWDIVSGKAARAAFDLDAEPQAVRERYGFGAPFSSRTATGGGAPAWSQRVLLARRLVEAGVRLVTVDLRWWDTHSDNFYSLKEGFLPRFDRAYSALIEDLHQRGLLETTMVVAWGEFGRSPRISNDGGRDHWPGVFSAAVAGGGIQGGRVVGESDDKGGLPKDNAKSPQDVLATLYRHMNVDTSVSYTDRQGRPIPVLSSGEPIQELFS